MTWMNYAAFALDVALTNNIHKTPEQLRTIINNVPGDRELYHCYYDLEARPTFKDYQGLMRPAFDTIYLDLDSKGDGGAKAYADTKALCQKLSAENVPYILYFSGNKGFHIAIHKTAFGITEGPKEKLENEVSSVLYALQTSYQTMDTGIWNANRKFRAYRSQNAKTGLYKIRVKDLNLSLEEIRKQAAFQPEKNSFSETVPTQLNAWLASLVGASTTRAIATAGVIKELAQGTMEDDDSLKFRNMKGKKCIELMLTGSSLPQFNRHDIGLRIIYDLRAVGTPKDKTQETMAKWCQSVYAGDADSAQRVSDTVRMVDDAYSKPQEYKYGCYDEVRMAYCSAKCKIYNSLDQKKRAEPLDVTQKQLVLNQQRHDPSAGMTEGELADLIVSNIGDVLATENDFFRWATTHWERQNKKAFMKDLFEQCNAALKNGMKMRDVSSLRTRVVEKLQVPSDSATLYQASPFLFNFTDATYTLVKNHQGHLNLTKSAHKKSDFLSYCSPFPFNGEIPEELPKNGLFLEYLDTLNKRIGPDQVRVVKQMLGTALVPFVPRFFFLLGKTNSGKSTLAILMQKLVGERNCAYSDPTEWLNSRFGLYPMLGKLANIVTELPPQAVLDTNVMKKVRDRVPVGVEAKGKDVISAVLPPLHVYCCNEMPKSLEGNSGALNNRMTILKFEPLENEKLNILDLGNHLWEFDAYHVLRAAREGLADLINTNFEYFVPDESKQKVKDWQLETDPVGLFLEDVKYGEFEVTTTGADRQLVKPIFEGYKKWCEENGYKAVGSKRFNRELERHGLAIKRRDEGGTTVVWNMMMRHVTM